MREPCLTVKAKCTPICQFAQLEVCMHEENMYGVATDIGITGLPSLVLPSREDPSLCRCT